MVIKHDSKYSLKMRFFVWLIGFLSWLTRQPLWTFALKGKAKRLKVTSSIKQSIIEMNGMKVLKLQGSVTKESYVIYFHGGGFVMPTNGFHLHFITNLFFKVDTTLYFIDYPLAPRMKAPELLESLESVIKQIQKEEPNKLMVLMGDSAGGNLALVLSKRFSNVQRLFLMSPWMDLSMSNPLIDSNHHKEVMFTKGQLLDAAKAYQGNYDFLNPKISPIYDDFSHQTITIFSGINDILYFDSAKFAKLNPLVELHEYPGLPHDFMTFVSGKEQSQVIDIIVEKMGLTK